MKRGAAFLLLLLPLVFGGCSVLRGAQLWAPESYGLERAAPGLYVETGMPAQQRTELVAAMAWAETAIRRAYGAVLSTPMVNACVSEACYKRFGGKGESRARVYGNRILISPRGLNGHFIAHEWSHAELHKRLTLSGYFRLPSWFDEGVAVAVSEAPEHSEAHWQYLESHNVPRPDRAELMSLQSLSQWLDAVHRYGEHLNQRMARGEPRVAPLYSAAGHEIRPWLAVAGTAGLLSVIDALNAGDDFTTAYRTAVEVRHPQMARPRMSAWISPDWAQQHRLALAGLAALGLHLLILGLIKLPVARIAPPVPSMVLQWVDLPIVKPQAEPVDQMNKPARPETRRGKDAPVNRENEVASDMAGGEPGATTISPQPKTEFTAPARLNPLELSATVRSLAREMAREEGPLAPAQPDNPTDRPILPLLDQALRKQRPGVQRYEGGLIEIISASGRVYCVQEQPNFARGGPVDPLSVPTNCP